MSELDLEKKEHRDKWKWFFLKIFSGLKYMQITGFFISCLTEMILISIGILVFMMHFWFCQMLK